MIRVPLVVLLTVPRRSARYWRAQDKAVTLAEAIAPGPADPAGRDPGPGQVRTAQAQRRSAWGSFLPSLTASSSASDFFAEGAVAGRPGHGPAQLGQQQQPQRQHLAQRERGPVHRLPPRRRARRRQGRRGRGRRVPGRRPIPAGPRPPPTQFFDALSAAQLVSVREASVRRAEEQLKVSVAKLRAGSATRSDSLRSLVTLGNTRLDLIQAQTDLATAEASLARQIGEIGRVKRAGRLELPPGRRGRRHRGAPARKPRRARRGSRAPRRAPRPRGPTCAPPAPPTGPA